VRLFALAPQFTGSRTALALLHLAEFQLDRRGAAENRHHDLQPGACFIDLLDNTIEGREGTIQDTDLLTYLEGNRRLRPHAIRIYVHDNLYVWIFAHERGMSNVCGAANTPVRVGPYRRRLRRFLLYFVFAYQIMAQPVIFAMLIEITVGDFSFAAAHRRIAISPLAGTLSSAAAFSIAVASLGASTVPTHSALLAILYSRRLQRFPSLHHARKSAARYVGSIRLKLCLAI
jgi:hypothetical protein